jgi:NADH dehydrogenase [ubiquinone] 1 alpha subcomplex assembly factor 1
MMRERIRTVGISVMLEHPAALALAAKSEVKNNNAPPNSLRASNTEKTEDDWAADGNLMDFQAQDATQAGTKRKGASYNFDLGIESFKAISEEGLLNES